MQAVIDHGNCSYTAQIIQYLSDMHTCVRRFRTEKLKADRAMQAVIDQANCSYKAHKLTYTRTYLSDIHTHWMCRFRTEKMKAERAMQAVIDQGNKAITAATELEIFVPVLADDMHAKLIARKEHTR